MLLPGRPSERLQGIELNRDVTQSVHAPSWLGMRSLKLQVIEFDRDSAEPVKPTQRPVMQSLIQKGVEH